MRDDLERVLVIMLIIATVLLLYVDYLRGVKSYTPKEIGCEHKASTEVVKVVEVSEPTQEKIVCEPMTAEQLAEEEYYDSLETLAICVQAESGNQDLMGKRLVVDVILNRVDSEDFPDNINSVIADENQFSSYSDGGMDKVYEPSEETFLAVQMELENRTNTDVLFFTAGNYNPYCEPLFKYGDHYFGK